MEEGGGVRLEEWRISLDILKPGDITVKWTGDGRACGVTCSSVICIPDFLLTNKWSILKSEYSGCEKDVDGVMSPPEAPFLDTGGGGGGGGGVSPCVRRKYEPIFFPGHTRGWGRKNTR